MASVVSLTALKAGAAVDLQDERQVRQRGFDLIYEARDLDLDQSTRDGLTQYRKNIDSTKARVKEAENIIDNKLEPFIKKKYWWGSADIAFLCQSPQHGMEPQYTQNGTSCLTKQNMLCSNLQSMRALHATHYSMSRSMCRVIPETAA